MFKLKPESISNLADRTRDKLYFFLGIVCLVIGPYFLARLIFQFAQVRFPIWVQLVIVLIFFLILGFWAWLISGDRGSAVFTQLYKQGIKWPFLFSIAMLVFALIPFSALSSIAADLNYSQFEPTVPKGEFWRLQDLYAWHFLDSVPGLKIPETLLWERPFKYKDHLSGVLLLAFKIMVILPVIGSFATWNRIRKENRANNANPPNAT